MLVFQTDCAIISAHSAAERTSRRLRLVCRSWNSFLTSLSNDFVAISRYFRLEGFQEICSKLANANRIQLVGQFDCICSNPCWYSRQWKGPPNATTQSSTYINRIFNGYGNLPSQVFQGATSYDILEQQWLVERLANLRALSTDTIPSNPFFQIREVFPLLTHLEIKDFSPLIFFDGLTFPTLTTLSLQVRKRTAVALVQMWSPARTWDLPKLLYLTVEGDFNKSFVETHLRTLLQSTGTTLRGLSVRQTIIGTMSPHGFAFPVEMWDWCPNLQWLGGTTQSLIRAPSSPPSINLKSILILRLFGLDRFPEHQKLVVRETPHLVAAYAKRHINRFSIVTTWERWSLNFFEKPLAYRAEWANFLVQFGLFAKRHGPPLRDVDGVAFDSERAAFVRQAVQFEVAALSERLRTTSWTNNLAK
ncbi:hypothetical protein M408DRAFT_326097 [Serendipita vermifera MAFF 305830]|uniref:F-box domain-containing protein n=1 Tax=Serendipita vermifera MAFF 305830 TaxID=933852 RepID=A0A0C3BPI0_SERVB|nr:hypothetical protein M408DRAFT_326097 [Serendipita vermifera MAFF 305830]